MKLIFDYRVLTHKTYTGVENYAKNILENIKNSFDIDIAKPKTTNKYLAHLWTQFVLPFKSGDILFCPANIAPAFVPKNKKLVVTIHDIAFFTHPNSFSKFFRFYYKLIIPFVVKRADKIITVSNYSKKEIEKYYPLSKGKIEVTYLGKDERFKKQDIEKKEQILYVGSMNERKNFIGVLQAFELLKNKKFKLIMVGNFSSNFAIDDNSRFSIEQAKKNSNIEFRSGVSDDELIKLYKESKLFVFPSFYEGFGLPVLEAMACGTSIVCSGTSSLLEVGGDAAVYCSPYDIQDIRDKMDLVLADVNLQNDMVKKGLQRAELFSWSKSAKEHIKVFNKVYNK